MPRPPSSHLADSVRRAQEDTRLADAVAHHFPDLDAGSLDTGIHPECQMLAHSLRAHGDANLAVSQYFAVALQQYRVVRQLMARLFDAPCQIEFLDFACGYGRLLRFLVHTLDRDRIHAAEIQTDALEWVSGRYGIHTLASTPDPGAFEPGRRFDMIWAASLFSHLPGDLFGRWLGRLGALLDSGGALCFSVHDEATLPPGMSVPESGLLYIAGSENDELDPAIYGTTYVSPGYVERCVREQLGDDVWLHRLPRLLAHEQDVYVLGRGAADAPCLEEFRRGVRGWLDELDVEGGRVHLAGWAGSLDSVEFDHVEIRLDDLVLRESVGGATPDVAEVLGHPGLARAGFACTLDLPDTPNPYLSLSAVAADGERALIYCGRLERG